MPWAFSSSFLFLFVEIKRERENIAIKKLAKWLIGDKRKFELNTTTTTTKKLEKLEAYQN